MSHQASPIVYKDDYNKNVLGQGPANPAIAFPENDRLKKIHDKTSKVSVTFCFDFILDVFLCL